MGVSALCVTDRREETIKDDVQLSVHRLEEVPVVTI